MNIAKYSKRIAAYIWDFLLSSLFAGLILFLVLYFNHDLLKTPLFYLILAFFLVEWLTYTILNSLISFISNGRTLGKLICGLRIVHKDISRLHYGDCLTRAISEGLFVMAIIDMFFVLIRHTDKTTFDRLSNSVVVDWRNRVN